MRDLEDNLTQNGTQPGAMASAQRVEAEGPKAEWRAFWSDKHLKDLRLYDNYSSSKEPKNHTPVTRYSSNQPLN